MEFDPTQVTTDVLETELTRLEGLVSKIRRMQAALISEADRRQLPLADGARTVTDWVASRLDVSHHTARDLVTLTHSRLDSDVTVDRAVALTRLATTLDKPINPHDWAGFDIAGLHRKVAHHRHVTPVTEQDAVKDRFVAIQPNLDHSTWRLWGQVPGVDGAIIEQALQTRADELVADLPPDEPRPNRGQRSADALVTLCADSLDTDDTNESSGSGATVTILCDARDAAATSGETGVSVVGGPRVGPQALDEVLCEGTVEVIAIDSDGVPLGVGQTTATIPPRIRRYVLARDGACTIDSCASRNRLQPHHIHQRAWGGDHDTGNLTTLCWYHHHRIIHGLGYTIDPTSPPQRRRLIPPGTDPP